MHLLRSVGPFVAVCALLMISVSRSVAAPLGERCAPSCEPVDTSCPAGYTPIDAVTKTIILDPRGKIALKQAVAYFSNWSHNGPGTLVGSDGTNTPGDTRSFSYGNVTVNERLYQSVYNQHDGSLHQIWNLTEPVSYNSVEIASAGNDLEVYKDKQNRVTLLYTIHMCAKDASSAKTIADQIVTGSFAYWRHQACPDS